MVPAHQNKIVQRVAGFFCQARLATGPVICCGVNMANLANHSRVRVRRLRRIGFVQSGCAHWFPQLPKRSLIVFSGYRRATLVIRFAGALNQIRAHAKQARDSNGRRNHYKEKSALPQRSVHSGSRKPARRKGRRPGGPHLVEPLLRLQRCQSTLGPRHVLTGMSGELDRAITQGGRASVVATR